jgi:hypothetical protein
LTVQDATPELRAYLECNGFSFARMAPLPPQADPNDESATVTQQLAAWGTKWDLDEEESKSVAENLLDSGVAYFATAWSPPLSAIEALSQKFSDDTFLLEYCELGMMFAGTAEIDNGYCFDCPVTNSRKVMRIAREVFGHEDCDGAPASNRSRAVKTSTGTVPDV